MKPSHFTSPRTLNECSFIPSHDPFERHPRRPIGTVGVVAWLIAAALALVAVGLIAVRLGGGHG